MVTLNFWSGFMADKSFWSEKKDKKWWGNFWFYYRTRILIIIVFLFFSVLGLKQCMTSVIPDLSVAIASTEGVPSQVTDAMEREFSKIASDVNGKDGVAVSILTMPLPAGKGATEYELGNVQQLFLELAAGESYLYLMDRDQFLVCVEGQMFEDISSLTRDGEPVYYVNINDSEYLKSMGFAAKKAAVCAGVRKIPESRLEFAGEKEKQENAFKILKEILK